MQVIINPVIIPVPFDMDAFIKRLTGLETVDVDGCDRHNNKKPNTRAKLPITRLCQPCRMETGA